MKILQINCVYRKGSTGKITYDIHSQLKSAGYESVVCYGRGDKILEDNIYKTCSEFYAKLNKLGSMISGIMYGGCFFSTQKLISVIERERPDIVHLQCLNGYFVNIYRLIAYLKRNHIKTVLTLHAEFMHTGNCAHSLECEKWKTGCGHCPRLKKETGALLLDRTAASWKKMQKAFDGFGDDLVVTSVSPWLKRRAMCSPILSSFKHKVVLNGLDTEVFRVRNFKKLKELHGLTNEKIIFHATPRFDNNPENIKGGKYVIELAEKLNELNVRFLVAGDYEPEIKVPNNVILLGRITDQKVLAQYYSMADVTLLTSKKETFSMIVAESLCCGTPVVGFEAGAPEQITIKDYSDFLKHGDMEELQKNVMKWMSRRVNPKLISEQAHKKYSKEVMFQKYFAAYRGLINESEL